MPTMHYYKSILPISYISTTYQCSRHSVVHTAEPTPKLLHWMSSISPSPTHYVYEPRSEAVKPIGLCNWVLLNDLLLQGMYNLQCKLCTLNTIHCILCNVRRTMYAVQCTPYNVRRTMYAVQYTPYNVSRTLYTVQCILYTVHCTMYNVHCTEVSVHCTLYSVQCTPYTYLHYSLYIFTY